MPLAAPPSRERILQRPGEGVPGAAGALPADRDPLMHIDRYAGLPPLPDAIRRLPELATDTWWSWRYQARDVFRTLDYPLWRATAHNPVRMLRAGLPRAVGAGRARPGVSGALRERDGSGWTRRGARPEHVVDADLRRQAGTLRRVPLGGVRPASVAADVRGRPWRPGRRHLQGGQRSGRAGCGRRVHVPAGVLPPARLGGRVAAGGATSASTGRTRRSSPRAGSTGRRASWPCRWPAARCSPPSGSCASAASCCSCSTPTCRRTRRGTASCPRGSTGATRKPGVQQEIVLGFGGVRALHAMGIEPSVWHLNEGHAAFVAVQRIRERLDMGQSFDAALEEVRRTTVFTTHTPVPAGHDAFPFHLIEALPVGRMGIDGRATATGSWPSAPTTTGAARSST